MATYVFKAMDLVGREGDRAGRGREQAERLGPARSPAASSSWRSRTRRAPKELKLPFGGQDQVRRPDDHDPAAGHDGQLRHDDPARAVRARVPDREQGAHRGPRRHPQGRRGRPAALGRDGAPPEGLQPALRRHDARRRDRRHPRVLARAGRRPARGRRRAAPPGQERDGLPDRRPDLRLRRPDRPRGLHRPGVRRGLQAVRRRPAGHHEAHRRAVAHHDDLLVGAARRGRRLRVGVPPLEGDRQGTPAVGPVPPAAADEDRRHRAEGRPGPLVADAQRARDAPACRSSRPSRSRARPPATR